MLLTLELIVFSFSVLIAFVTAIIQLLNKLSAIQAIVIQLQTEVSYIKDNQAQQHDDIQSLRAELRSIR